MNYFKKRAKSAKEHRSKQVLTVLLQTPFETKTVDEIGQETGLGPVVYPLLASLHRQRLIELEWQRGNHDSALSYRLTPEGLSHTQRLTPTRESGFARVPRSLAKPLYSRLAYRISKRFSNL